MRKSMWMATAVLGLSVLGVPRAGDARAQQTSRPNPRPDPNATLPPIDGHAPDPNDPVVAMREAARARAVMTDRQKKIVEDTAKLLALATELKQDVDKTTKDEMSLEVIRKADEIEKLAHDVKQRMKG